MLRSFEKNASILLRVSEEERIHKVKLIWMRTMRIRLFTQMGLLECKGELHWLIRCHQSAVNIYPGEYGPSMPPPVPPNGCKNLCKRGKMVAEAILLPTDGS